jgi:hypothetical protein
MKLGLSACLAAVVLTTTVLAQNASVYGVYNGMYVCAQESTNFKLTLTPAGDGGLTGVFTFYPTRLAPKSFTFTLYGLLSGTSFQLQPTKWDTPAPEGGRMAVLRGSSDVATGTVAGVIALDGCTSFKAIRDQGESASIDRVIAEQRAGRASMRATPGSAPQIASAAQAAPEPPPPTARSGTPAPAKPGPGPRTAPASSPKSPATPATPRAPAAPPPIPLDWMNHVQLAEPEFVRGLFTEDPKPLLASRTRALAYVARLATVLRPDCPDRFGEDISDAASAPLYGLGFGQIGRGDGAGIFDSIEQLQRAITAADRDARALVDGVAWVERDDKLFDPKDPIDVCEHEFMEQIATGMRLFLSSANGSGAASRP